MKTACSPLACFVLFSVLILLGSNCGKEYSFEGSRQPDSIVVTVAVPAIYTLAGSPADCGNSIVAGTYTAGANLSSSQTVTISVNVTVPGTYSLTTDTVNGMSFSQSGTFSSTGNQSVVLLGHGQPNDAGIFTFKPNTNSSQCFFDVSVQNAQPLATYVLESGAGTGMATCIGTLAGSYKAGQPLNTSNSISMSVYVANLGNFTVQTKRVNGISFSYSGRFTAVGSQYITLTGSGTPLATGTYNVTPQIVGPHPLGGEACSVAITVQ